MDFPERNGRKTLTTVQGLPKKFDQKKILKVIKKKFGKLLGLVTSMIQELTCDSLQWHDRQRQ
jgi:translation initiation factor 1 (eIF-1/SUI1)